MEANSIMFGFIFIFSEVLVSVSNVLKLLSSTAFHLTLFSRPTLFARPENVLKVTSLFIVQTVFARGSIKN